MAPAGTQTHAELEDDKVSLPLDSFDWLLRHGGALLPLLPLGLRLASQDRPFQDGQGTEVLLYIGLSLVRVLVYSLHVSGAGCSAAWLEGMLPLCGADCAAAAARRL